MFSSQFIAYARRVSESLMTETCTIETETPGRDEFGAPLHGWELVASGVPCRLITAGTEMSSTTEIVADAERLIEKYRLVVPYSTNFSSDMRVTINKEAYSVVRVLDNRTDETDRQAIVMRFADGA